MDYPRRFQVRPGRRVRLRDIETDLKHGSRAAGEAETQRLLEKLRDLQRRLYAGSRYSLLICLQGMDTAGKDGTVTHVMGAMDPRGCRVTPFRTPTPEEATHDFLWRAHRVVPARGEVAVFNRSYYESVLIERVHKLVPKDVWSGRYQLINDFEAGLMEHDTLVLKFFLHISKAEQLKRFEQRLDDPAKRWKISEADYTERERWDEYMQAYEEMLAKCSTGKAPWYVIPADHKWFRDLAITHILVERLGALKLRFPEPTVDIEKIRREFHAAAKRR